MKRILSVIVSFMAAVVTLAQQPITMTRIGLSYLGTPYAANILDRDKEEKLIIQTNMVDCLTYIEYVLAEAIGPSLADNVQKVRYRDGIIDGYPSRLHYTSDWIDNGVRNSFLTDITAEYSPYTMKLSLSYMSSHPHLYKQLTNSPENLLRIAKREKALSGTIVHYLPKSQLPNTGLPWIVDGDIIAITTSIRGLDIAHVGIAHYIHGKLHLMHASSTLGRVVISKEPLNQMLANYKLWTGVRVVRLLVVK